MGCGCQIDNDFSCDIGLWEIILEKTGPSGRARKCFECGRDIAVGEHREKVVGQEYDNDDKPKTYIFYTCIDCLSVANVFFCNRTMGGMWDDMEYHIEEATLADDIPYAELGKLTPAAFEKVCAMIEDVWKDMVDD